MRARNVTLLLAGCSVFAVAVALAGSGTIVVKDGNSVSRTYDVITDGSGNFVAMVGACDGAAAAQCAAVKPSGTASAQTDVALVVRNPDVGTTSDSAYAGGTASSSVIAALRGIYTAVGAAIASAVPSTGSYIAGQARSSEATAASNGNLTGVSIGLEGKLINLPYANKENMLRGAASATGTAATTIISAQGASVKIYVTGLECYRSDNGTSAITVLFNDSASTQIVLPNSGGGGGSNITLNVPLVGTSNGSFTFASGSAVSTVYCNAQGYAGA